MSSAVRLLTRGLFGAIVLGLLLAACGVGGTSSGGGDNECRACQSVGGAYCGPGVCCPRGLPYYCTSGNGAGGCFDYNDLKLVGCRGYRACQYTSCG